MQQEIIKMVLVFNVLFLTIDAQKCYIILYQNDHQFLLDSLSFAIWSFFITIGLLVLCWLSPTSWEPAKDQQIDSSM